MARPVRQRRITHEKTHRIGFPELASVTIDDRRVKLQTLAWGRNDVAPEFGRNHELAGGETLADAAPVDTHRESVALAQLQRRIDGDAHLEERRISEYAAVVFGLNDRESAIDEQRPPLAGRRPWPRRWRYPAQRAKRPAAAAAR